MFSLKDTLHVTPVVRFNQFSAYGIKFTVILRAQAVSDRFVLQHEFIKRLQQRFTKEGTTIAVAPWTMKPNSRDHPCH